MTNKRLTFYYQAVVALTPKRAIHFRSKIPVAASFPSSQNDKTVKNSQEVDMTIISIAYFIVSDWLEFVT